MPRRLLVLAVLLGGALAGGPLGAQTFVRGDANGDGLMNIADPIHMLFHIFSGGALVGVANASDVNDNGVTEIADVTYMLAFLFAQGASPPAPVPIPGVDTTPPSFPAAPNGTLAYRIDDAMACAGAPALVSIFVDNLSPLEGMSFHLIHDPVELTYASASDDPIELIIGAAPNYFFVDSSTPGRLWIGLIPDYFEPTIGGLPPGTDQRVADIVLNVTALAPFGAVYPIQFLDEPAATPPHISTGAVAGQVVLPTTTNGSITATCPTLSYLRGDANEDGAVSISDAVFLTLHLFLGGPASECVRSGDCNADGALDIADAVYLLSAYFAGGPPIPAPYPACDADPFTSPLPCASLPASCP
jgi:hypothetical protein